MLTCKFLAAGARPANRDLVSITFELTTTTPHHNYTLYSHSRTPPSRPGQVAFTHNGPLDRISSHVGIRFRNPLSSRSPLTLRLPPPDPHGQCHGSTFTSRIAVQRAALHGRKNRDYGGRRGKSRRIDGHPGERMFSGDGGKEGQRFGEVEGWKS